MRGPGHRAPATGLCNVEKNVKEKRGLAIRSSTTSWWPSRSEQACWGWAGFFGVTGLLLLVPGLHTTVTWPFGGDRFEYANIAFGHPFAGFRALLLFAAVYLWRRTSFTGELDEANATGLFAFKPVSVFIGALLFATAMLTARPHLLRWAVRAFTIGGTVLLLFGAMNSSTHIGTYLNIAPGTSYRW